MCCTATTFAASPKRSSAQFEDPELKALIEQSLAIGPSHALPLTNLTPQMRWYYGAAASDLSLYCGRPGPTRRR